MMEIIRMIVVLSAITGLSGFVLSGLKVWTTPSSKSRSSRMCKGLL